MASKAAGLLKVLEKSLSVADLNKLRPNTPFFKTEIIYLVVAAVLFVAAIFIELWGCGFFDSVRPSYRAARRLATMPRRNRRSEGPVQPLEDPIITGSVMRIA